MNPVNVFEVTDEAMDRIQLMVLQRNARIEACLAARRGVPHRAHHTVPSGPGFMILEDPEFEQTYATVSEG